MAPSPIRIAILEADTPFGKHRAKYGSYGGVFVSLLYKAADASNVPRERLKITGWDVVNVDGAKEGEEEDMGGEFNFKRTKGCPRMEDVDAVLITGSHFNAFDNDPWIVRVLGFVNEVLAQDRVKFIGVCWGHQIVGRALGAKVAKSGSGAWEISVCKVILTEKGKELFAGKDALSIFQSHLDLVYHYPDGVEALGSSDSCKVQGMYIPKRVITLQGHPEFTADIMAELLQKRRGQDIFSEEIYGEAMARVGRPQDGVLIAQAFLKFLMEE